MGRTHQPKSVGHVQQTIEAPLLLEATITDPAHEHTHKICHRHRALQVSITSLSATMKIRMLLVRNRREEALAKDVVKPTGLSHDMDEPQVDQTRAETVKISPQLPLIRTAHLATPVPPLHPILHPTPDRLRPISLPVVAVHPLLARLEHGALGRPLVRAVWEK